MRQRSRKTTCPRNRRNSRFWRSSCRRSSPCWCYCHRSCSLRLNTRLQRWAGWSRKVRRRSARSTCRRPQRKTCMILRRTCHRCRRGFCSPATRGHSTCSKANLENDSWHPSFQSYTRFLEAWGPAGASPSLSSRRYLSHHQTRSHHPFHHLHPQFGCRRRKPHHRRSRRRQYRSRPRGLDPSCPRPRRTCLLCPALRCHRLAFDHRFQHLCQGGTHRSSNRNSNRDWNYRHGEPFLRPMNLHRGRSPYRHSAPWGSHRWWKNRE